MGLNVAVFKAIGGVGVYYGGQLGEEVPWCTAFPYNLGLPDPQYWGVVIFVWGLYAICGPSWNVLFNPHFTTPWLETFWYGMSVMVLEHTETWKRVEAVLDGKGN